MIIDEKTLQDYLDGKLSDRENEEVQAWLAGHSDDPVVNTILMNSFEGCRVEADIADELKLSDTKRKMGLAGKFLPRPAIWLSAAVVALLLALPLAMRIGYNMHKDPAPIAWHETSVPVGGTQDILLSDGTKLTLNAGSRITWPERFEGSSREVFLEGEVMAVVTKDPEHPFIIHSSDVDVRVYGTTFNFKSYHNSTIVETTLLEGSVYMDVPGEKGRREVRLLPGDIAQYDRSEGNVSLNRFATESYKPFTEGKFFNFFNVPLKDIAEDLERSFGASIVIADNSIANQRFLAFFTNGENLDEILRLLARNGRLRYSNRDGTIYLYKR
ncbi:MAG: DUF4974 domain-containing protein [Bacteroidales bacterium]|nr:DUF4974 domain-containing protein [Bacteroidales bacterium]